MTTANLPTVAVPLADLERMGERIAKSGLFGVKTADQAIALMLVAQAEGLHPAIAARDFHIIQGRPSLKTDAMLARFQAAGGRVKWTEYTDDRVAGIFSHAQGGELEVAWTMAMAKTAGLAGKDNWRAYPRAMLRSRVVSEGIRSVFPGVVAGFYTPEENADMPPPPRDVTIIPHSPARKPADDLAEFAGEHPPKAEPPPPAIDQETGEIVDDGEGRFRIPMPEAADKDAIAAWCSDYRDALMGAGNEDDLLDIRTANKDTMMKLANGGNGQRKAADRLQGIFNACQLELRRKAAAA